METKDLYKVLEVSKGASQDEIRRSYRRLARKYHPDANPGDEGAEERFKGIQQAYEILSNPEKRREYDEGPRQFFGAGNAAGGRTASGADFQNFSDLSDLFGGFGNLGDVCRQAPPGAPRPRAAAGGAGPPARPSKTPPTSPPCSAASATSATSLGRRPRAHAAGDLRRKAWALSDASSCSQTNSCRALRRGTGR